MTHLKPFAYALLAFLFLCALASCSGSSKSALSPVEPGMQNDDLPISLDTNHDILAVYDAVIDPVAKTFTITPADRIPQYHFPLTQLYTRVLEITGYNWTPNFWADIKLKHPFPGTVITGYDPRVIAILPANPGVSFNYPTLDATGNNSVVLEPDGYTKLYDNLGSGIPGNVNPFKAYFKEQPYRVWDGMGVTEDTQRWEMNYSGFGGPLQFKLVVDVSTNYPNPPQPIENNAPEPVQVDATVGSGLSQHGGSAEITVTLMDWQGTSGIGGVKVEAPDLFNGTASLAFSEPGLNPNEYIYSGIITNTLLAPEGDYKYLVTAWDQLTSIYLYYEFTVAVSDTSEGGNLLWAKRAGGSVDLDKGHGITSLSDNSIVVTGQFKGAATFGLGEPNQTVLNANGTYWDIYVARYNPDGTLAWAKRAGGTSWDEGNAITSLSDDSTVITGWFAGSATFGPGEPHQKILSSAGGGDIFIARYNPDGTLAWAKRAGGEQAETGVGITTLSDNSTVVTGVFSGTATFGPGETPSVNLTSAGGYDVFVAAYYPNGTLAWAKRAGGAGEDVGSGFDNNGITTLSDNSTVLTGEFFGSATFGSGEANQTILSSAGELDIFIAQYNPNGTLAWVKRAGGIGNDCGEAITTLSDNSTVVTGWFRYSPTFGQGESHQKILTAVGAGDHDVFIARYNPDGTLEWAKQAGGTGYELGEAITNLSENSTVVSGYFGWNGNGSMTFGQGEPNETILNSSGDYDIFIAAYYPDGTLAWARRAGGAGTDNGWGITSLSDNSTVVTGNFMGPATFGQGETNETILSPFGYDDIFIARFRP